MPDTINWSAARTILTPNYSARRAMKAWTADSPATASREQTRSLSANQSSADHDPRQNPSRQHSVCFIHFVVIGMFPHSCVIIQGAIPLFSWLLVLGQHILISKTKMNSTICSTPPILHSTRI
jgi:hypothetical protein